MADSDLGLTLTIFGGFAAAGAVAGALVGAAAGSKHWARNALIGAAVAPVAIIALGSSGALEPSSNAPTGTGRAPPQLSTDQIL